MAHRCVRTVLSPARSTQAFRMRLASEQNINGVVGLITRVLLYQLLTGCLRLPRRALSPRSAPAAMIELHEIGRELEGAPDASHTARQIANISR